MASGIQKHFHKHTVKVNPATEIAEKKNNGMVEHNHKAKNGFVPEAVITINDVHVELDNSRASEDDSSVSSSDSSVI